MPDFLPAPVATAALPFFSFSFSSGSSSSVSIVAVLFGARFLVGPFAVVPFAVTRFAEAAVVAVVARPRLRVWRACDRVVIGR